METPLPYQNTTLPATTSGADKIPHPDLSHAFCDRLALAVLALVAVAALLTFRDYGLGWDDYTHSQMGELVLALYGSGFSDRRAFSFVNLFMYGSGFDVAAALLAKVLPFDLFEVRRLAGAAVGIIGLSVTWRIGRRVGGPIAGLLALVLLATCPLYYGHMFINAKDTPFAVAVAVLVLGLVRVYQDYPRPSPTTILLFGIGLGATLGTRVMGVVAALYVVLPQIVMMKSDFDAAGLAGSFARAGRLLLRLVPGIVLAYLLMGLLWPWAVLEPLNPLRALTYFQHFFEKPWRELFAGTRIMVPDMPWSYLPTLFGLKLPEIFLISVLAGTAVVIVRALRGGLAATQRAALLVVLGAAFLPILFTVVTRPALYNGVRHFLFVVPPMAVLAGYGATWLLDHLRSRDRSAQIAGAAILCIGLVSPLIEMVRLHPYQYVHFNRLIGGIAGADNKFMLDYWGLSFKQASRELREKLAGQTPAHGGRWKIAICGPHRPAQVELGEGFEATWDSRGADLALTLGEFYCRDLRAPILVEVMREGIVFARAYDIRGLRIPVLLTIPPPAEGDAAEPQ
jgi:hypothetical protein